MIPPILDANSTDVQDANNIQTTIIDSGASQDSTRIDSTTNNCAAVDTKDVTEVDRPSNECCETLNESTNEVDLAEKVTMELSLNKEETVSTQVADGLNEVKGCPEETNVTLEGGVLDCNPTGNV